MAENNGNNLNENAGRNNAQLLPVQPRQPQNLQVQTLCDDMSKKGVSAEMKSDRGKWKRNTCCADPTQRDTGRKKKKKKKMGLLRFAMEAREPDAPPALELHPMDNERRAFLARALEEMVTDAVVILRAGIPVLTDTARIQELDGKEDLTPEIKAVFDSVLDVIEDLDVANDFCKLGGFDTFVLCYNTENSELWVHTNNLLAGVCQNFPAAQALALERGLLHKQLELLQLPDTKHKDKFIYAISCSVREYEPGCRALLSLGGCEALARLVAEPETRVQMKAACLLQHLMQHYTEAQERITALNLPSLLVPPLLPPPTSATEHVLLLLKTSVKTCPRILEQAQTPGLGLKEALDALALTLNDELPEEIATYSTEILKLVFGKNVYDCSEEADR